MKKYTFCDNWTKIVAQNWFGARIYPRALTLGSWPLNFRIKILKYKFSLVFVKKNLAQSDQWFKRKLGTNSWQTDNRQTTDRQTDRHFWADPHPYGKLIFFFFFFAYGRERTNRVKFIPPCLLCKFALLTCSARRGIKIDFSKFSYFILLVLVFWKFWNRIIFISTKINLKFIKSYNMKWVQIIR